MKEEKTKTLEQIIDSLPEDQRREINILLSDLINRMNIRFVNWRNFKVYDSCEKSLKTILIYSPEYVVALVKEAAKAMGKRMHTNELKDMYKIVKVIVQLDNADEIFTVGNNEVLYSYIFVTKAKMKKMEEKAKKMIEES